MRLKQLEITGFKSFARKAVFSFESPISSIVGPNGSGKSNVTEAIRFVLGEQSMKSLRGKRGEDLIWNGSGNTPRANFASVSISFDNHDRAFGLDFDEVEIRRTVSRDGVNQYFLNGSQVRLRDVFELLAQVHVGASGHHIISQGEADRILNANIKDRRVMIEEALGLKIYHWKIDESEKKLGKTEENVKEVELLRREIAPHIKFLKKQVEHLEKAEEMRRELQALYADYLTREKAHLTSEKKRILTARKEPSDELAHLDKEIARIRKILSESGGSDPKKEQLMSLEGRVSAARTEKDELSRALGRVEGAIDAEERIEKRIQYAEGIAVPFVEVKSFVEETENTITDILKLDDVSAIHTGVSRIRERVRALFLRARGAASESEKHISDILNLRKERTEISLKIEKANTQALALTKEGEGLRAAIEAEKDSSRDAERALFGHMARVAELKSLLDRLSMDQSRLDRDEEVFKNELREGAVLVGRDILEYESAESHRVAEAEPREKQEERRRAIEKLKIRLEDAGIGSSDDILKEYRETSERDSFLEHELEDLSKSAESLRTLIVELNEKLTQEFGEGITKINKQFQEFFNILFGGGSAKLTVIAQKKRRKRDDLAGLLNDGEMPEGFVPEEEETEEGIDIVVSLPRKKTKGLQMLSGGERALTSIALIFAVSQVNPPPFLVLDETDAALDEANSRRYGDMLENLAKLSQLIVVTHNRETMSHAGLLYGVTMGSDAVSKLLSVKFDEATQYAK
ncbi:MAG: AAA family ATPase [Patescibacteria group bacterium]